MNSSRDRADRRALIVHSDESRARELAEMVQDEGFEPVTVSSLEGARARLSESVFDLAVAACRLPDGNGLDLLDENEDPALELIALDDEPDLEEAVEALRRGAHDYLPAPVDATRLRALVHGLARTRRLKREVGRLRQELRRLGRFGPLVGASQAMADVYERIERVGPTDATVLIVGESGTGKELVAQAIHQASARSDEPFVPLNCAAVSPSLIESELFGHEAGSFTGATQRHQGCFERASGGTLFLDEITEMPEQLQAKLLRVLESGRIRRVGGEQDQDIDVRVLAATNHDPHAAVAEGRFREDLFYRLNVFPIDLPPLRARGDDVLRLAQVFLDELNEQSGSSKRFADETLEALERHAWPGNVRELRNLVRQLHILADARITPDLLPQDLGSGSPASRDGASLRIDVGTSLAEAERRLILATLEACEDDRKAAARRLGVSVRTIYNRLREYGLTSSD